MDEVSTFTYKEFFNTLFTIPKTLRLIFILEKKYAYLIVILNLVTALIPLVNLYVNQALINSLMFSTETVIKILVLYFFIQCISTIFSQLENYMKEKFEANLSYSLNIKLMETTSALELTDYEQSDMYNMIEKVTQESTYKPFQLFNAIITAFAACISLFASLFFIGTWNGVVAVLLLIIPILSLVLFLRIGQLEFITQWKRADSERKTWYIVYLLTHDFSFKEIRLNNTSQYFISKYSYLKRKFINQDLTIQRKRAYFDSLLDLLLNAVNILVILIMIFAVKSGEILVGNLISLMQALAKINTYSLSVIQSIYIVYNTSLFMQQLFVLLKKGETNRCRINRCYFAPQNINKLSVENVSYNYPNTTLALQDINVTIKAGELTAIVGQNGSGKSTLVKILSGLYTPTTGIIKYDNYTNNDLTTDFYQKNISVLFQDFVKYELTLKENIRLGDIFSEYTDDKIIQLLDRFNLEFLKVGGKYDLDIQLGNWFQEGRQVSGGQWQKIALIRAFLKDSSIYILDEPNSALDSVSEKEIFDYFIEKSKKNISIYISHSIDAAKNAKKIIVMHEGKIEAIGTHSELMKNCVYYRKLYYAEKFGEYHE